MGGDVRVEQIGNATLYCGDALEVLPTLEGVDHVITDPPYSGIVHETRGRRGAELRKDGGPQLERLGFGAVDPIQGAVARLVCQTNSGWFLAFSDIFALPKWRDEVLASGGKSKSVCLWVKPDCAPQFNGQKPATAFECIGVFWCGPGFSRWNAGGKRGLYTHMTNPTDRDGMHPTEKPWRLLAELLTDFTHRDELVCDPFMGSGTTGVACARLGRRFIGIEIHEPYFDIACRRIEKAYQQADLFLPAPKVKAQQLSLDPYVSPTGYPQDWGLGE